MRRFAVAAAACVLCGVTPRGAAAQMSEGGRYEVSPFVSYSRFDPPRLQLSRDYGLGVRVGGFLTPNISVELAGSRTHTRHSALGSAVVATELGASTLVNLRAIGYNQLFAGAGYSWLSYSKAAPARDHAVHVFVGDRIPLSRMSAMRVDAKATYTPNSHVFPGGGGDALTFSLSVGISLFWSERPARDSDGDAVPDRFDSCPATPLGVIVDARGCPRDTDADGVFDGLDRCPSTPVGARVDAEGCYADSDADGLPDHLDRCPATPAATAVDAEGCPVDSDRDGVPDADDVCPATPAGAPTDTAGCPLDSDADSVPDYLDRCEGTPQGQPVDELGCTILFEEREGERVPLVLRGVNFELDEALLTPDSYVILEQVAASLVANAEVRVEVAGHTDASGSPELNRALSLSRAEAVRDYLIAQGVAPQRLVARGYGPDQPAASNATEEGRAQNRRVELRLIE